MSKEAYEHICINISHNRALRVRYARERERRRKRRGRREREAMCVRGKVGERESGKERKWREREGRERGGREGERERERERGSSWADKHPADLFLPPPLASLMPSMCLHVPNNKEYSFSQWLSTDTGTCAWTQAAPKGNPLPLHTSAAAGATKNKRKSMLYNTSTVF